MSALSLVDPVFGVALLSAVDVSPPKKRQQCQQIRDPRGGHRDRVDVDADDGRREAFDRRSPVRARRGCLSPQRRRQERASATPRVEDGRARDVVESGGDRVDAEFGQSWRRVVFAEHAARRGRHRLLVQRSEVVCVRRRERAAVGDASRERDVDRLVSRLSVDRRCGRLDPEVERRLDPLTQGVDGRVERQRVEDERPGVDGVVLVFGVGSGQHVAVVSADVRTPVVGHPCHRVVVGVEEGRQLRPIRVRGREVDAGESHTA